MRLRKNLSYDSPDSTYLTEDFVKSPGYLTLYFIDIDAYVIISSFIYQL